MVVIKIFSIKVEFIWELTGCSSDRDSFEVAFSREILNG